MLCLVAQLCVTLCDPRGFSRQGYWSGLPCPTPGDRLNPGIGPRSPTLQADSLLSELPGKPMFLIYIFFIFSLILFLIWIALKIVSFCSLTFSIASFIFKYVKLSISCVLWSLIPISKTFMGCILLSFLFVLAYGTLLTCVCCDFWW